MSKPVAIIRSIIHMAAVVMVCAALVEVLTSAPAFGLGDQGAGTLDIIRTNAVLCSIVVCYALFRLAEPDRKLPGWAFGAAFIAVALVAGSGIARAMIIVWPYYAPLFSGDAIGFIAGLPADEAGRNELYAQSGSTMGPMSVAALVAYRHIRRELARQVGMLRVQKSLSEGMAGA